ncbi:MAG: hypothetical protein AB7T19_18450 [Planctomycetota bacterium]
MTIERERAPTIAWIVGWIQTPEMIRPGDATHKHMAPSILSP